MRIITSNPADRAASAESLQEALQWAEDASQDRYVIVEKSGQWYMQCLAGGAGWQLEKREGDEDHHYRAQRRVSQDGSPEYRSLLDKIMARNDSLRVYLDRDEVEQVMMSYISGTQEPEWLDWEQTYV